MNIRLIISTFLISFSLLYAQKTYYVSKNSDANFTTIKEVNNNMNIFNPGDKILFHRGEKFDDAPLVITKSGSSDNPIIFGAYGEGNKPIIGNTSANVYSTIRISKSNIPAGIYGKKVNYIIIENLKIVPGNKQYSDCRTIQVKGDHNTIRYCTIIGTKNSTTAGARGISIEQGSTSSTITHNDISYFDRGIRIFQPLNTDISYNHIHHIYRNHGLANKGGNCLLLAKDGNKRWDCKYSVNIHNNVFSDFEHSAMWVGLMSNLIIEKNIIENPLDETIYRGGVHHGGVGKLFDNTGEKLGNTGIIFRYNVVRNLGRVGLPNYTYDEKGNIISTNNGYDRPVYKHAREDGKTDFGIRPQDQANNTIGGLGYANILIHNNLFYNIHKRVFNRGYTHYYKDTGLGGCVNKNSNCKIGDYRPDLASYFYNNTLYNVGYSNYITKNNGVITSEIDAQSPTIVKNNIIHVGNKNKNSYAIKFRENGEVSNNIFINRKGETEVKWNGPNPPENTAIYWRGGKRLNKSATTTEFFNTNPKFNNKEGTIFLPNIGINGVNVPDFRILNDSSPAYNNGVNVGKDPSGVDISIDIQGNQRNANTIGAFGIVSFTNNNKKDSSSTQIQTPTITQQPTNINAKSGDNVTLSVKASCNEPIGYQWWKSPFVSVEESKIVNGSKYSGATTNKLTIKNINNSDNGTKYICEVYNTQDHENHKVNSNIATINVITELQTPTITQQPTNINAKSGDNVTLSVKASCNEPIGYQWWKFPFVSVEESKIINGSKYSGATTNKLTIKNINNSDNGTKYICEVYNTQDHNNHWINSEAATILVTIKQNLSSNLQSNIKVFLEGAFQDKKMKTILLKNGYLPKNQPFNISPYNFSNFQKVNTFPNTIVDWVLIELRTDLTTKVKRFAALLNNDGQVLNTDGSNNFSNQKITDGNYYLVIYHRNHLPVMSASKISIKNSVINYDFTTDVNKAYGKNALIKLPNGKFAMYAGDSDKNKKINDSDYTIIKNNIFSTGYKNGDIDMNGIVNVLDYSNVNKNTSIKSNVP